MPCAVSAACGAPCHFALNSGDVDWHSGRLTVHAAKTAHHKGGGVRVLPLFPEPREHLQVSFDAAESGTRRVINRLRLPSANFRTMFLKVVTRAGFTPWPRLFPNLPASCETN
jgi:integrase